jgi:hypothetical protein
MPPSLRHWRWPRTALIVVDPGAIAAFDVNGISVTIINRGRALAPFTVVQTSGAPAVSIEQCAGAKHFAHVVVAPVANLPQVAARGGFEVINCQAVWCTNLIVGSAQIHNGSTTNVLGAPILDNAGLCALFAQDSSLLSVTVAMRGFDNAQMQNGTCYGGDALRLSGVCHVSMVVHCPGLCELIGGAGAAFGGSAIHCAQANPAIAVDVCGQTRLVRGSGSHPANSGGYLAVNNDRGIVSIGPNITIDNFPVACLLDAVGHVSLVSDVVAPGSVAQVSLTSFFSRPCVLAMRSTVGFGQSNGVQGLQVSDWLAQGTIVNAAPWRVRKRLARFGWDVDGARRAMLRNPYADRHELTEVFVARTSVTTVSPAPRRPVAAASAA